MSFIAVGRYEDAYKREQQPLSRGGSVRTPQRESEEGASVLDGFCRVRPIDLRGRLTRYARGRAAASSLENANVTHNRVRPRKAQRLARGRTGSILEGGKKDEEEEEVNLRNGINPWWPI